MQTEHEKQIDELIAYISEHGETSYLFEVSNHAGIAVIEAIKALRDEVKQQDATIEKMREGLKDIKRMKIATADGELSDENSKWMLTFDKLDAEQLRNLLWHIRGIAQQTLEASKKGGE